jgi:hypothetical protein
MALTIGLMAKVGVQSALAAGQSQAAQMGLGQKEAQGLAVANLMEQDSGKGLIKNLMSPGAVGKGRLQGTGLQKDLKALASAALGLGPGRGLSAGSTLKPQGLQDMMAGGASIINRMI